MDTIIEFAILYGQNDIKVFRRDHGETIIVMKDSGTLTLEDDKVFDYLYCIYDAEVTRFNSVVNALRYLACQMDYPATDGVDVRFLHWMTMPTPVLQFTKESYDVLDLYERLDRVKFHAFCQQISKYYPWVSPTSLLQRLNHTNLDGREYWEFHLKERQAAGWVYGDRYSKDDKTSPTIVEFDALSRRDQSIERALQRACREADLDITASAFEDNAMALLPLNKPEDYQKVLAYCHFGDMNIPGLRPDPGRWLCNKFMADQDFFKSLYALYETIADKDPTKGFI